MQIIVPIVEDIQITFGEKKFTILPPDVMFLRDFQKKMRDPENDKVNTMVEFCEQVGVPKDILATWGLKQLTSFFTGLTEDEKKS